MMYCARIVLSVTGVIESLAAKVLPRRVGRARGNSVVNGAVVSSVAQLLAGEVDGGIDAGRRVGGGATARVVGVGSLAEFLARWRWNTLSACSRFHNLRLRRRHPRLGGAARGNWRKMVILPWETTCSRQTVKNDLQTGREQRAEEAERVAARVMLRALAPVAKWGEDVDVRFFSPSR